MFDSKFIVSECGNSPQEAWDTAIAYATMNNVDLKDPERGILDKKGFKVIGKIKSGTIARQAAVQILNNHKDANSENDYALCLIADKNEYFFLGVTCSE